MTCVERVLHTLISSRGIPRAGAIRSLAACKLMTSKSKAEPNLNTILQLLLLEIQVLKKEHDSMLANVYSLKKSSRYHGNYNSIRTIIVNKNDGKSSPRLLQVLEIASRVYIRQTSTLVSKSFA
jgi:hypothetical protein